MDAATRDAHGLHAKFGFTPLKKPEVFMERQDPVSMTPAPDFNFELQH